MPRLVARASLLDDDWDEVGGDAVKDDAFWKGISETPPPGQINTFAEGADFATARLFAATRTFAVAPWSADVKAKPIFAVSDATGNVAQKLAETAFMQFGSSEKAKVRVVSGVSNEGAVRDVVAEAAKMAPPGSLAIERSGALVLYTVADPALGSLLAREALRRGVPCIDALEPVLMALERCFSLSRDGLVGLPPDRAAPGQAKSIEGGGTRSGGAGGAAAEDGKEGRTSRTVFAVSDSSGGNAYGMVCAALRRFSSIPVQRVTLCREVRSLEQINHIAQEALATGSPVIFTFASPGMSRFMRQQCERGRVHYADVFQPVVLAFEKYLDYPPVGVPGGHDLSGDYSHDWDVLPVEL